MMFAEYIKRATITGVLICISNFAHALDCQIVSGSESGIIAPVFQVFTNGQDPVKDTFEFLGIEGMDWIFEGGYVPTPMMGTTYPTCVTGIYRGTSIDIIHANCFIKSQPKESRTDAGLKIQKLSELYISFHRAGSKGYDGKWYIKETSARLEMRNGEIVGLEGTYTSHADYLCFE